MSEYLGSAILEVGANLAPLRAGLAEAERMTATSLGRMHSETAARMNTLGQGMSRIGSSLTRTLTLPIVGVAAAATKLYVEFDRAMEMIHTQAGASQREVDKLKNSVLDLAKTTAFSPTQLADALYHLESIGLRGSAAMRALRAAADGAAVGHANLELTASTLGTVWINTGRKARNFQAIMSDLNAAVGTGNLRMNDLVSSLGNILAPAQRAGLQLNDVLGAIALLSDEGIKVSSSTVQMATAFHYLTDPTQKAQGALAQIGIQQGQLAADMHKPQGLLTALRDLQGHLERTFPTGKGHAISTQEQQVALSQYRDILERSGASAKKMNDELWKFHLQLQGPYASALVEQERILGDIFPAGRGRVLTILLSQLDSYQQKLHQIQQNEGNYRDSIAKTYEQPAVRIQRAWASLQSSLTRVGQQIGPPIVEFGSRLAADVGKIIDSFNRLPAGTKHMIETGGLVLAGLGPALRILGFFTSGLSRLWNIAVIAQKLATGQRGGAVGGMGETALSSVQNMTVATMEVANMEVANLLARSFLGGPGGGGIAPIGGGGGRGGGGGGGGVIAPRGGAAASEAILAEDILASEAAAGGQMAMVLNRTPQIQGTLGLIRRTGQGALDLPAMYRDEQGRIRRLGPNERALLDAHYQQLPLDYGREGYPGIIPASQREMALRSGQAARMQERLAGLREPLINAPFVRGNLTAAERGPGFLSRLRGGASALGGGATRLMGGLGLGLMGVSIAQLAGHAIGGSAGNAVSGYGSWASMGAGVGAMFGPEGAIAGAIAGALGKGLSNLLHRDSFGTAVVKQLPPGFGGDNRQNLQDQAAKLLDQRDKLLQFTVDTSGPSYRGPRRVGPSQANQEKAALAAMQAGKLYAQQLELGWNQYSFQSEPLMFRQFKGVTKHLPEFAKAAAAESAIRFSSELEKKGRLAVGSTEGLLIDIRGLYPNFERDLGIYGARGAGAFTKALDFKDAETNTRDALQKTAKHFAIIEDALSKMQGDTVHKTNATIEALKGIQKWGSGPASARASRDIQDLKDHLKNQLTQMTTATTAAAHSMAGDITAGSATAAANAVHNFKSLASAIDRSMAAGSLATSVGTGLLLKAINATLQALGSGRTISLATAKSYQGNPGALAQITQSIISGNQVNFSTTGGTGHGKTYEQGGLVQFGAPGQRGRDEIPVNFGGTPIVVGAGEVGMVLTGQQQRVADTMLSPIGGLDGLFQNVNHPHWAYDRGGRVPRRFAKGGTVDGMSLASLNHVFPSGVQLSPTVVAAIAEAAGLPGITFSEIAKGESSFEPGQIEPIEKIGIGGVPVRGWGLWQLTTGVGNDALINRFGGTQAMLNPIINAQAAAALYRAGGIAMWHGTRYLRDYNAHWTGQSLGSLPSAGTATQLPVPQIAGQGKYVEAIRAGMRLETDAANKFIARNTPTIATAAGGGGGPIIATRHGKYTFPLPSGTFRLGAVDQGWDIAAPGHTPLLALADGTIIGHGISGFGPWAPIVRLKDGSQIYYGHAGPGNQLPVGTQVHAGQVIGEVGAGIVGMSTGPHLEIGYYPPGSMSAGAAMKSALGYARGGFVRGFARGGHTHSAHAASGSRGSFGRTNTPPRTRRGTRYTSTKPAITGKPKKGQTAYGTRVVTGKASRPGRLPRLKALGDFAGAGDLTRLQDIDRTVQELGSWQGFIQSLHGVTAVSPALAVVNDDGTTTNLVNWGSESAKINTLTGGIDQSTGQPTKGIWDRLREIGAQTDTVPLGRGDVNDTELGLVETILGQEYAQAALARRLEREWHPWKRGRDVRAYDDQSQLSFLAAAMDTTTPYNQLPQTNFKDLGNLRDALDIGKLTQDQADYLGEYGTPAQQAALTLGKSKAYSWGTEIRRRAKRYKDALAKIVWLRKRREKLANEQRDRLQRLKDRFDRKRHEIHNKGLRGQFAVAVLRADMMGALRDEETRARAGVGGSPPAGWLGSPDAWGQMVKGEHEALTLEFASRRTALDKQLASRSLGQRLSSSNALNALSIAYGDERTAILDTFSTRRNGIADEIRALQGHASSDRTFLSGIRSQTRADLTKVQGEIGAGNVFHESLKPYNDPMGTLAININRAQTIDIPVLLREIATLKHTSVDPTKGGSAGTNSALLGLMQQQIAQLGQAFAVSQAQYGVLSHLTNLPPFGGSFAEGGVVPGPTGAARMIIAHGGETVVPPSKGANIVVQVLDGAVDPNKIRVIANDEALRVTRSASRLAARNLPSRGGGQL